jgi:excisionase family DNA binding protein
MAKMFYTTDEVAQKLGVSGDKVKELVTQNKLREFRDGAKVMFKVDQVDKLASDKGRGGSAGSTAGGIGLSDSGIALAGDSMASDVISLADTGTPSTNAKDDTVVTGQGKNVFESGEIKPSDTGAQTRIQSAIDDQLSLEGVGSGSGLLDLTRESDDTSLGAELLDEIYPGGDQKGDSGIASASGIFEQTTAPDASGPSGLEHMASTSTSSGGGNVTEIVERADPASGAFGGLAFASVLVMIVTAVIAIAFFGGFSPGWVQTITSSTTNILIFGVVLVVVSALFAGIGFFASKSAS